MNCVEDSDNLGEASIRVLFEVFRPRGLSDRKSLRASGTRTWLFTLAGGVYTFFRAFKL